MQIYDEKCWVYTSVWLVRSLKIVTVSRRRASYDFSLCTFVRNINLPTSNGMQLKRMNEVAQKYANFFRDIENEWERKLWEASKCENVLIKQKRKMFTFSELQITKLHRVTCCFRYILFVMEEGADFKTNCFGKWSNFVWFWFCRF